MEVVLEFPGPGGRWAIRIEARAVGQTGQGFDPQPAKTSRRTGASSCTSAHGVPPFPERAHDRCRRHSENAPRYGFTRGVVPSGC